MAIAFDASAQNTNFGTTCTVTHTCTGTDLIVLAGVRNNDAGDTLTGVTYDGVTMTLVAKIRRDTFEAYLYVYRLVNPATGAKSCVATSSNSVAKNVVTVSYTGVDQTSPIDSSATGNNTGSNTSLSLATTVVASGCWLMMATFGDSTMTAGTGTTKRQDDSANHFVTDLDSNGTVGTGSQSLATTWTGGSKYAAVICSLLPVGGGGRTTKNTRSWPLGTEIGMGWRQECGLYVPREIAP